ncbi:MAG TPA: DUF177 domain-containing protein [Vicinamibacterales bacterium]|nr:DUF177 domain-containing protein [Vicinamibacterales bacterium]
MSSLQLDVTTLFEGLLRIERTDDPSSYGALDGMRAISPVSLAIGVRKDDEKVRVAGTLQTVLELDCSRCLEAFPVPVDAVFDLLYLPSSANIGEEEQEIEEDDLDTAYYREGVIDLAELVREQLYLALPMKPLCQEACRGLCPECGTNLNSGACECTHEWEDPRLAPLKALARKQTDA